MYEADEKSEPDAASEPPAKAAKGDKKSKAPSVEDAAAESGSAVFHRGPICGGQWQARPQCSCAFGVDFGPRYVSRLVWRLYCGVYRGMYPCIPKLGGRDVSTMLVSRCIGGCIGVVVGAIHVSRLYRDVFRVRSLNTCLNTSPYITIHVSESKLSHK